MVVFFMYNFITLELIIKWIPPRFHSNSQIQENNCAVVDVQMFEVPSHQTQRHTCPTYFLWILNTLNWFNLIITYLNNQLEFLWWQAHILTCSDQIGISLFSHELKFYTNSSFSYSFDKGGYNTDRGL